MKNPIATLFTFRTLRHYFSWNTRFIKITKIELKKKVILETLKM